MAGEPLTLNIEAPFAFDELFFSRTDGRGVIVAGNEVFQRISQYSWSELLNHPHNVIRHPDMPRGVFHLMWRLIKQNEPVGAYVKNRTRDGHYYWVFAIVTPIEGGYLSVRLKPASPLLPAVVQLYRELRQRERLEQLTPAASDAHLLEGLQRLGFGDYTTFMSVALRNELQTRTARLGRRPIEFAQIFEHMTERATNLVAQSHDISERYDHHEHVPLNLSVKAAQLGAAGKSLGVISEKFNSVSQSIRHDIDAFLITAQQVFRQIYIGQFLLGAAHIQREVVDYFEHETGASRTQNATEVQLLHNQMLEYEQRARSGLGEIARDIQHFERDFIRLQKSISGLEVIRVVGKVDAARLPAEAGLAVLLDKLGEFQDGLATALSTIAKHNSRLRSDTATLIASLERRVAV